MFGPAFFILFGVCVFGGDMFLVLNLDNFLCVHFPPANPGNCNFRGPICVFRRPLSISTQPTNLLVSRTQSSSPSGARQQRCCKSSYTCHPQGEHEGDAWGKKTGGRCLEGNAWSCIPCLTVCGFFWIWFFALLKKYSAEWGMIFESQYRNNTLV